MAKKQPDTIHLYTWRHGHQNGFHLEFAGSQVSQAIVTPPPHDLATASRVCPTHGGERHLAVTSVESNRALEALLSLIGAIRPLRYMPEYPAEEVDALLGTPEQRNWLAIERGAGRALALRCQWDPGTLKQIEDGMRGLPEPQLARKKPFDLATYAVLLMAWAVKFRHQENRIQADENEKRAASEIRATLRRLNA